MVINKRTVFRIAAAVSLVVISSLCFTAYCLFNSDIKVYEPLQYSLEQDGHYLHYLRLLHKSERGDTAALRAVFMFNDFWDGAAYGHGYVIDQLINKENDTMVASVLKNMDSTHVEYVKGYILAAMDHFDETPIGSFIHSKPQTCAVLHITRSDVGYQEVNSRVSQPFLSLFRDSCGLQIPYRYR